MYYSYIELSYELGLSQQTKSSLSATQDVKFRVGGKIDTLRSNLGIAINFSRS